MPPFLSAIKRRIIQIGSFGKNAGVILRDKNYNYAMVDYGFQNRFVLNTDYNMLNRIMIAYNKAKKDQSLKSPAFHPSNEWVPIYESHMNGIMAAMNERDINRINRIYSNFFREPCSVGLHGLPVNMKKYFSGQITRSDKKLFLFDSLYRYKLWLQLTDGKYPLSTLDSPLVGNPYGYFIDGHFVKVGSEYSHYYALKIQQLIQDDHGGSVFELGGGYGAMAYYLLRNNPRVTYLNFDLPENAALSAFYLLSAFPERRILLYGEGSFAGGSIGDYDIIIMPSFEIEELPEKSIDVVFNSYSLAEMSLETIKFYLAKISTIAREHILHVNHTRNAVLSAEEFGIETRGFNLVYKRPALWNAGINMRMDEWEYLYKRGGGDRTFHH